MNGMKVANLERFLEFIFFSCLRWPPEEKQERESGSGGCGMCGSEGWHMFN